MQQSFFVCIHFCFLAPVESLFCKPKYRATYSTVCFYLHFSSLSLLLAARISLPFLTYHVVNTFVCIFFIQTLTEFFLDKFILYKYELYEPGGGAFTILFWPDCGEFERLTCPHRVEFTIF